MSTSDSSDLHHAALPGHAGDLGAGGSARRRTGDARWGTSARSTLLNEADVLEFVRRLRLRDDEAGPAFVRQLIERGTSFEAVLLELLAPSARRLGEEWEQDRCDFVDVTLGLGRMQRILREFSHDSSGPLLGSSGRGRILVTCLPGEQHTLGVLILAEFFVRAGWAVAIGAPMAEGNLTEQLRRDWFDVVGFSIFCDHRLPQLEREVRTARRVSRNPGVRVLVGGAVFRGRPELATRVGADGAAADAAEALNLVNRLVPG